jgi:hypothetical protein
MANSAAVGAVVRAKATKAIGAKPARQRYGTRDKSTMLTGDVLGFEGIGTTKKWLIRWRETGSSSLLTSRSFVVVGQPATVVNVVLVPAAPEGAVQVHAVAVAPEQEAAATAEDEEKEDEAADPLQPHGVQWKVVDGVTEDARQAPRFGTRLLWGNHLEEQDRSVVDYFSLSFPLQMLSDILQWSASVTPPGRKPMDRCEFFQLLGCLYAKTRLNSGRRSLWGTKDDGLFPAAKFGSRFNLSQHRFDECLRYLRVSDPELAMEGDRWGPVRGFVAGFNQRRQKTIHPSWQLCVDESVSSWRGRDGNYCSDGMPHVTKISRKPEGVGAELKNVADAETKVIMGLEIQEGKEAMQEQPFMLEYKKAGTAQLLRLTHPWHGSGRSVVGDSAFASYISATAMRDHGLYFKGLVKTASRGFPKKFLGAHEHSELGDSITLVTEYKGERIFAHGWGDRVRKDFICTDSTTLEAAPSHKRRWREMTDADGLPIGSTESFFKFVKRRKCVEEYFQAASIIDINNHLRQGGLALERSWQTLHWEHRVIATILGIIECDAYLLWNHFHCPNDTWTHSDFTEELALQLLKGAGPRELRSAEHAQVIAQHEPSCPHDIRPLSSLPQYSSKKTKDGRSSRALRSCAECSSHACFYCRTCSDHSKQKYVVVCGLNSKHGSTCIVNHIINN